MSNSPHEGCSTERAPRLQTDSTGQYTLGEKEVLYVQISHDFLYHPFPLKNKPNARLLKCMGSSIKKVKKNVATVQDISALLITKA